MPTRRRIITSPTKKVISSPLTPTEHTQANPATSETVDASLEVQPEDVPIDIPPDPLQAVDYAGNPIEIGMYVDLYFCQVVGFRADSNNRLNVLVVPSLNKIITNDPANELNGQVDGKAILVSGYHCVTYPAIGSGASRAAGVDAAVTQAKADKDIAPTSLPSNFLAPSIFS
jgi:hypothetical protein